MATAGSIVIDLVMRTGLFETDTARAEKRLKELQKVAKQAGQVLGTALVAGATALAILTKESIDNADAVRDLGVRLGESTELLSSYGYAASQTGTDIDTLGRGLKVLAKNAADAINPTSEQAKVFDALGIKVADAEGKLKDLGVLVPEIADKFSAMADGTTKAALAQALFGKAGLDLTEFLNSGAKGLDDFTQRARELGIVIGQDTADAADEFNDKLGDARAIVGGLGLAIAQELLPDLNRLIGGFTDGAGAADKMSQSAKEIADFLRALGGIVKFLYGYIDALGDVIGGATMGFIGLAEAAKGVIDLDWDRIKRGIMVAQQGADLAYYGEDEAAKRNPGAYSDVGPRNTGQSTGGRRGRTVNIRPGGSVDERALQNALGNVPAPKAPKGTSGKSEAEKAADQLKAAHDRLNESLDQQIALFNQTGEAVKLRYELENGELAKLEPLQKAVLLAKAEQLDQMDAELDVQKRLAEEDKQRFENFTDVMGAIKDQSALVSMSADEQEVWNNLKWLGADASQAMKDAVTNETKALQAQRDAMDDQIEVMDSLREAGKGLFRDIIDDPANWKNAVLDALDSVQARILDMIAENWMDQLFGKQGQPAGGSTGGFDWAGLIGSFFGGAKAGGGDTIANRAYLVGEHGPEMFVPRTAGTVMTAGETSGLGGSKARPVQVTQQFYNPVMYDQHSEAQRAQDSARKLRVATRFS